MFIAARRIFFRMPVVYHESVHIATGKASGPGKLLIFFDGPARSCYEFCRYRRKIIFFLLLEDEDGSLLFRNSSISPYRKAGSETAV